MALLRFLFTDNPTETICCGHLWSLPTHSTILLCQESDLDFLLENLLSLGHVVLVRLPQCPTYSELITVFSKICFSKIYSC